MKSKKEIQALKEISSKLMSSDEYRGLAVIMLAMALEKQLKKVVIYNYRKQGLSALFVRKHLLSGLSYSQLLKEFDVSNSEGLILTKIWKENKMQVKDLNGIMKIRNRIVHSNGGTRSDVIEKNVNDLIYVIENLQELFDKRIGYNGIDSLPKNVALKDFSLNNNVLNRNIVNKINKL